LEDNFEFMSEADMIKAGFDENLIQKARHWTHEVWL
jgi:hypothetical protein